MIDQRLPEQRRQQIADEVREAAPRFTEVVIVFATEGGPRFLQVPADEDALLAMLDEQEKTPGRLAGMIGWQKSWEGIQFGRHAFSYHGERIGKVEGYLDDIIKRLGEKTLDPAFYDLTRKMAETGFPFEEEG